MKFLSALFSILFISANALFAQPDFDYAAIKSKYPDEDVYTLRNKTSVTIEVVNGNLSIVSKNTQNLLLLSDKATSFSSKSIFYYDETEDIFEISAACYVPNEKNNYKRTLVTDISTRKPIKENIFYDDYKEIYFRYPGLKNGAVTELSYSQKYKDPRLLSPFYFVAFSPVNESEFSVTFPKEVKIRYLLAGEASAVQFEKTETKKSVTMTWRAKNMKGYDYNIDNYNIKKILPHVIFYIDEYEADGKKIKILSDTRELYRWYQAHINPLLNVSDNHLKALADSITDGIKTEKEKIKKIYYWVQDNIKYIAFEQGLGGYIPRPASLVCSRRYGDCKDKSSLLYALMKAAGIKAYFTWVGTRDIPYTYAQLPSPMVDNHMIVSVRDGNEWVYLDGTSYHLPYGYPSQPIQSKEALIAITPDSFVIAPIPVVNPERNLWVDSVSFSADGKNLSGTGATFFTGLIKNRIDNRYFDEAADKRDDEVKKLFELGTNKCKTDMTGYKGEDSYDDTLFCYYKFSIPDYASSLGKKLYVNMNLLKNYHGEKIDTTTEIYDNNFYFTLMRKHVYTMKVPANYTVSAMPRDSSFSTTNFGFKLRYRASGDSVILEKEIWNRGISYPPSTFADWNKMYDALNEVYSDVVVLEQK